MQGRTHPLPSWSLSFLLEERAITSGEFIYPAEQPGGSKCLCEAACPANREAPTRTELLLETWRFDTAQGLETIIPIWKIESILRLEFCFMILCISSQKWAQPKVPLTTRCWGGFTVKILFISQLAVKSQIMLKHSHYPESPQLCFPGLWRSLPLSGQGKILIRSLMNSLLPPRLPCKPVEPEGISGSKGHPWVVYLLPVYPSSPPLTQNPIWWWVRLYRKEPRAVSFQPSRNRRGRSANIQHKLIQVSPLCQELGQRLSHWHSLWFLFTDSVTC